MTHKNTKKVWNSSSMTVLKGMLLKYGCLRGPK